MSRPVATASLPIVLLSAACGGATTETTKHINVALHLQYPDAETADNAKELMFLIRDANMVDESCSMTLFDMRGTAITAVGTLIDRASITTMLSPLYTDIVEGPVDLFAYTYSRDLDRFCSSNGDCIGSPAGEQCGDIGLDRSSCSMDGSAVTPGAGGCARVVLEKNVNADVTVVLTKTM